MRIFPVLLLVVSSPVQAKPGKFPGEYEAKLDLEMLANGR